MPGNKSGAAKMKAKMIERFGSEEAWKAWMRNNASKGGKVSSAETGAGFAHKDADPVSAGRKGGKVSRRGKQTKQV